MQKTGLMRDFKNLHVWQRAHRLALDLYAATRTFPPDERYGLTVQIRGAGASISANLAEGSGRGSDADFARFVQMSIGSASELENHLLFARDLCYLSDTTWASLSREVVQIRRMLINLLLRLKS